MERFQVTAARITFALLVIACVASDAAAQRGQRIVYNPVTGQSEPEQRSAAPLPTPPAPRAATPRHERLPVEPAVESAVEPASLLAPAYEVGGEVCHDGACGDLVGCGSKVAECSPPGLFAGFEFVFVKPRFESNLAFTTTIDNGGVADTITDTEFDYDLELNPRVYLGVDAGNGVALRATWWQFDHEAATATGTIVNAGDVIAHPAFGTVNINAVAPGETLTASSALNAFSVDLEAVRETSFAGWDLEVGGGVRYSSSEQSYTATQTNVAGALAGTINSEQTVEGIGPTISLGASTPLTRRLSLYSKARGSLLFGDGESVLTAVESIDTANPFNTSRVTNRDDLLSIGEVQLGFHWQGRRRRGMVRRPFATFAMEGQVWNGAGTATSEEGTLGFFGFTTQLGFDW